jgi:hypothetical protein
MFRKKKEKQTETANNPITHTQKHWSFVFCWVFGTTENKQSKKKRERGIKNMMNGILFPFDCSAVHVLPLYKCRL